MFMLTDYINAVIRKAHYLNLIKYWEKEIEVFANEIVKAEKRLTRKG